MFFKRDWIVLKMAVKRGLFRLLARISRVFAVIVKHAVMLFSRIVVTVGFGAILGGRSLGISILSYVHLGISPSFGTDHISHITH
jgi:hypothetical protein